MPSFQRLSEPASKFYSKGINLNRPVDQLEVGEFSWILNMRPYQESQLNLRPGYSQVSAVMDAAGATYLHSLLRLNDSTPTSTFRWCRFVGDDQKRLWFGQGSPTIDPSYTDFQQVSGLTLSGNPLSLIASRTWSAPDPPAIYIGDYYEPVIGTPEFLKAVFFRPADNLATGPRLYLMGVPPPNDATVATAATGSELTGTYWWRFVARNTYTGARSNPSNPTRTDALPDPVFGSSGLSTGLALAGQGATMTLPNPGSATLNAADFIIDVYRFGGTVFDWHYVGSDAAGATFVDNLSDIDVLSAATLPLDAAGAFALVQPFPSIDIEHSGTGTLAQSGGSGTPTTLTSTGLDVRWPPGTTINISGQAFTTYRFPEGGGVELTQDVIGILGGGGSAGWIVPVGATLVGQPMAHLWGPYGAGVSGLYIFACGDPLAAGTLYWTNGNDPDSSAYTNNLQITDPSEPLVNGMMFDTRNYVWSSRRMFEIIPDPTTPGNFLARQIPNAAGLYAPWGLCDGGSFLAYIGYDGIYISQGVGAESITDQYLYPWFSHDVVPGLSFSRGGDSINPADPNNLEFWRLSWQDGILYFDWPPVP